MARGEENEGRENTHVFVYEGGVCAFPSGNTATAASQGDEAGLDPGGTEAVEEVGLAGDFVLVEVCVAKFADVNLSEL